MREERVAEGGKWSTEKLFPVEEVRIETAVGGVEGGGGNEMTDLRKFYCETNRK